MQHFTNAVMDTRVFSSHQSLHEPLDCETRPSTISSLLKCVFAQLDHGDTSTATIAHRMLGYLNSSRVLWFTCNACRASFGASSVFGAAGRPTSRCNSPGSRRASTRSARWARNTLCRMQARRLSPSTPPLTPVATSQAWNKPVQATGTRARGLGSALQQGALTSCDKCAVLAQRPSRPALPQARSQETGSFPVPTSPSGQADTDCCCTCLFHTTASHGCEMISTPAWSDGGLLSWTCKSGA